MANFVLSAADGTEYSISPITQIGRESTCQIILDDPLVSRVHVTLWVEKDTLFVRDERSSNGAFVNGAAIAPGGMRSLSIGDQLRVGNTTFSVANARVISSWSQPPSMPRHSLPRAVEQTDIGFAVDIPEPRPRPKPTLPAVRGGRSPLTYFILIGLAVVAILVLLIGCGALIFFAAR